MHWPTRWRGPRKDPAPLKQGRIRWPKSRKRTLQECRALHLAAADLLGRGVKIEGRILCVIDADKGLCKGAFRCARRRRRGAALPAPQKARPARLSPQASPRSRRPHAPLKSSLNLVCRLTLQRSLATNTVETRMNAMTSRVCSCFSARAGCGRGVGQSGDSFPSAHRAVATGVAFLVLAPECTVRLAFTLPLDLCTPRLRGRVGLHVPFPLHLFPALKRLIIILEVLSKAAFSFSFHSRSRSLCAFYHWPVYQSLNWFRQYQLATGTRGSHDRCASTNFCLCPPAGHPSASLLRWARTSRCRRIGLWARCQP